MQLVLKISDRLSGRLLLSVRKRVAEAGAGPHVINNVSKHG